ncbi:hypothetical protein [Acinetobacter sp. Ac_5812]|uniref:hypothetical protein n=1 Tax=Acinetobacter sp. Ac_5812 TaxID=1848937 RepID=UPI00148F9C64|nr:hypothetical protein [Acinetobacter sp. Ac_5812]NNP68252.1 hypothetical protein [Acinetobacter sp. Ac_5812]
MKYRFLWALYRQNKGKAIRKGCWFLLPSLFNLLCFLNFHHHFIDWQVNPKSTIGRLIISPQFLWVILWDSLPFLLLLLIHQKYLARSLNIWVSITAIYFLIDAWYWSSYSSGTLLIVAWALPFLKIENTNLMGTYIQPSS